MGIIERLKIMRTQISDIYKRLKALEILGGGGGGTIPSLQDVINVNSIADRIGLVYTKFIGEKFINTAGAGWLYIAFSAKVEDENGDEKLLLYGNFDGYNSVSSKDLIRLNANGSIDTTFNVGTGFNNYPFQGAMFVIDDDNNIYLSGAFTQYNGVTANRIISLNDNGAINSSFNSGTGFNDYTTEMVKYNDTIYVGGNYTQYNGVSANRIISLNLDGTINPFFATGTGFNNAVTSIVVSSDNSVFVAGYFTQYNGVSCPNLVKLDEFGVRDMSFNAETGFNSTNSQPIALKYDSNTDTIRAVGYFTQYRGVNKNRIVQINTDGTINEDFNIGTGFNNNCYRITEVDIDNDTKYLIEGIFNQYNGVQSNSFIILNIDGSIYLETDTVAFQTGVTQFNDEFISINTSSPAKTDGERLQILINDNNGKLVAFRRLDKSLEFSEDEGTASYYTLPYQTFEDLNDDELVPKHLIPVNSYFITETLTGGKWIDDKPIYRKIVVYSGVGLPTDGNFNTTSITNIDELIDFRVNSDASSDEGLKPWGIYNTQLDFEYSVTVGTGGEIYIIVRNIVGGFKDVSNYDNITMILEYTKTTD